MELIESLPFGALILAAGASSRMGRPKLLLPWGSTSILGYLVAQWHRVGAGQIAVVCAGSDEPIHTELERIGFPAAHIIMNPEPARGMMGSIQCGARWTGWDPALGHIAIVLGDQPHLADDSLLTLAGFAAQHPHRICQPTSNGRPRHPVFLPRQTFGELAHSAQPTLRDHLHTHAQNISALEIKDPGLDIDLDTPADYEQAVGLFRLSVRSGPSASS